MEKIKLFLQGVLACLLRAKAAIVKLFLTIWRFLKKWGAQIINLLVLLIAYGAMDGTLLTDFIVGFWLFVLLVYYVFVKIFGAGRLLKRDEE